MRKDWSFQVQDSCNTQITFLLNIKRALLKNAGVKDIQSSQVNLAINRLIRYFLFTFHSENPAVIKMQALAAALHSEEPFEIRDEYNTALNKLEYQPAASCDSMMENYYNEFGGNLLEHFENIKKNDPDFAPTIANEIANSDIFQQLKSFLKRLFTVVNNEQKQAALIGYLTTNPQLAYSALDELEQTEQAPVSATTTTECASEPTSSDPSKQNNSDDESEYDATGITIAPATPTPTPPPASPQISEAPPPQPESPREIAVEKPKLTPPAARSRAVSAAEKAQIKALSDELDPTRVMPTQPTFVAAAIPETDASPEEYLLRDALEAVQLHLNRNGLFTSKQRIPKLGQLRRLQDTLNTSKFTDIVNHCTKSVEFSVTAYDPDEKNSMSLLQAIRQRQPGLFGGEYGQTDSFKEFKRVFRAAGQEQLLLEIMQTYAAQMGEQDPDAQAWVKKHSPKMSSRA